MDFKKNTNRDKNMPTLYHFLSSFVSFYRLIVKEQKTVKTSIMKSFLGYNELLE